MPKFERRFDVEALISWDRKVGRSNVVRALFDRWALPFTTTEGGLRVAVRAGYLNFYRLGQSVARLTIKGGEPEIAVHQAYVDGRMADPADRGKQLPQRYVTFTAAQLADPATVSAVPGWIETAASHAGDEKMFVDTLCLQNPGVLDVEMALPADDLGGRRVAPRMDLVLAQLVDGQVQIAFWEVKCATNPELRAREDYREDAHGARVVGPRVIEQLRTYQRWFAGPGRTEEVATAYRETARVLLALRDGFATPFMQSDEHADLAARLWQRVATAPALPLILPPGIVVADEPHWRSDADAGKYARATASFAGQHRERLATRGITLHLDTADRVPSRTLPTLRAGTIAA